MITRGQRPHWLDSPLQASKGTLGTWGCPLAWGVARPLRTLRQPRQKQLSTQGNRSGWGLGGGPCCSCLLDGEAKGSHVREVARPPPAPLGQTTDSCAPTSCCPKRGSGKETQALCQGLASLEQPQADGP